MGKSTFGNFEEAFRDYLWLLEKSYPRHSALKMVADHHRLSGTERSLLFRGGMQASVASGRKRKLVVRDDCFGKFLHIDTYNQWLTVAAYLKGNTVFLGMDDFLRDALEARGRVIRWDFMEHATRLIIRSLVKLDNVQINFCIDQKVDTSLQIAEIIRNYCKKSNIPGRVIVDAHVDQWLISRRKGVISSSDSTVIDRSSIPFFDLARYTLCDHYNPRFFELASLLP
ncbi:MAG: DUF434 domain-containing protein [Bacteroidales bacterium]|nr:DUF434 domain-containing protein [Bacteroidales bacterium]